MTQTDLFREESSAPRSCGCVDQCRRLGWPQCRAVEVYHHPSARVIEVTADECQRAFKTDEPPSALARVVRMGLMPVFMPYDGESSGEAP